MRFTIHPELPAVDVRRAQAWYPDELGLDPVTVDGEPFDPHRDQEFQEMLDDTGTAKSGVDELRYAGRNDATAARLVTDDFDAVHARLVAKGLVFEEYPNERNFDSDAAERPFWESGALVFPDGEKTAWFRDSEGNLLALGSSD